MKNKRNWKNQKEGGITLIALVVTIVVLLILAGITINSLVGDNGIFRTAEDAKEKWTQAEIRESIEIMLQEYQIQKLTNHKELGEFLQEKLEDQTIENLVDNGDGSFTVEKNGFEVVIGEDGDIITIEKIGGVKPEATYYLYQTNGQELEEGSKYEEIIVTVKITNIESIENIDSIVMSNSEGEIITKETKPIGVPEGEDEQAYSSFKISKNMKYTITIKATTQGYQRSKVLTVDVIGKIKGILVNKITLNQTSITVATKKTVQITATVEPNNAENKELKWTSNDEEIATVNEQGVITGVSIGNTTITVIAQDGSGTKATVNVTVEELKHTPVALTYSWEELNQIAKAISDDSSIDKTSVEATVTIEQEEYTVGIGDTVKVTYNGTEYDVRIIGLNHDELKDTAAYGGNNTYAGITFDFVHSIARMKMNTDASNKGGWGKVKLRQDLNGYTTNSDTQTSAIGGLGANLSNKDYIKQVKKEYIPTYNQTNKNICEDYLWILSCNEVLGNPGEASTQEGTQYRWYIDHHDEDSLEEKQTGSGGSEWWFRSPRKTSERYWCCIYMRRASYWTVNDFCRCIS